MPKIVDIKQVHIGFKVPPETLDQLDQLRWARHTTRSEVIRTAVDHYFTFLNTKSRCL